MWDQKISHCLIVIYMAESILFSLAANIATKLGSFSLHELGLLWTSFHWRTSQTERHSFPHSNTTTPRRTEAIQNLCCGGMGFKDQIQNLSYMNPPKGKLWPNIELTVPKKYVFSSQNLIKLYFVWKLVIKSKGQGETKYYR